MPTRVARDRDLRGLVRLALPHHERSLEGVERVRVLAGVEVLPAEVVEERPGPVGGRLGGLRELDPAPRPREHPVPVARRERAHVRCVAREPVLAGLLRSGEGRLEERQRGGLVAARAAEATALQVDADPRPGTGVALRRRLVEEAIARVEALAQPLDARQLRERLGAKRAEAPLGAVEVAEVPVRTQRVHQLPVVEKCW